MDQGYELPRELKLKKAFKMIARTLLTACSREEFLEAFSAFRRAKQDVLYQLFIHVIAELHENIEEDFESICAETQNNVSNWNLVVPSSHSLSLGHEFVRELKQSTEIEPYRCDLQVAATFDKVEQLEEEQKLDTLAQDKTNLLDVEQELSRAKKAEISYLKSALEKLRSWYRNLGQAP
ncbi:hypothetical protein C5167_039271 [Papaver somniferum]|uniref:Uncharacterized protein n=1 Tax=Papaver somniferum TaxID=3469 RepID=A0A4Y7IFX3_PAPSO|nr:hypothetical protein C5167_039271 [Papaver somniferum]